MADGGNLVIGRYNSSSSETVIVRSGVPSGPLTPLNPRALHIQTRDGAGVYARSIDHEGVYGYGDSGVGVRGSSTSGTGVRGSSASGVGVNGNSDTSSGVSGYSPHAFGVSGASPSGTGVRGSSDIADGVHGHSSNLTGVRGTSPHGFGVSGSSIDHEGVRGISTSGVGVSGVSDTNDGVRGTSDTSAGVRGISTSGVGVVGVSQDREGGFFAGGITVIRGPKKFQIDHPLDPENKYLEHTCVESSEMKNVYDGVARLDEDGSAWVDLPEWFEALNGDFRYQLTAVGGAAPNLHVAEEVSENRFKIGGGQEGIKVCWQLTGTRKDPWAAANPFEVEQEKPEEQRGRYLDPSLYDAPEEQRVMIGPLAEAAEEERPPEPSGIDLARLEQEHHREMEELRRRMEEEAPPEST